MIEIATVVLDALILGWLIGTWFYEGHHRRCSVVVICKACGSTSAMPCHTPRSTGGQP